MTTHFSRLCAGLLALGLPAFGLTQTATAQLSPSRFADRVIAFDTMSQAGGGLFDPSRALGGPGGATDVHSLGIGGFLTLGFAVTITDGPGPDLLIGENPFFVGAPPQSFAEMAFVEVSSNGVDFARVPNRYFGPQVDPGAFGTIDLSLYSGLAGAIPVRTASADPFDPVRTGGDAIDLATLRNHPLVLSGQLDLQAVTQVRLVDVRTGVDTDSAGIVIRDPGSGSADIDFVAVLNTLGSVSTTAPTIELEQPLNGPVSITVSDPDGISDLDPTSWRVALYGTEIPIGFLLPALTITNVSPTSFTLSTVAPLPVGLSFQWSSSISDLGGQQARDFGVRPLF